MGCVCFRASNSIYPKTKIQVTKTITSENSNSKKNYLFCLKIEVWVKILDYLPYKNLNISGKVCKSFLIISKSQTLLYKFFKNNEYKVKKVDHYTYSKKRFLRDSFETQKNSDHSKCTQLIYSEFTPDKQIDSPKFPNCKLADFPSNSEYKKVIKSQCIDFFTKTESEDYSDNKNNHLNKSKQTLSELDKTPNFIIYDSGENFSDSLINVDILNNNKTEESKKMISMHESKRSNNQLLNKIDPNSNKTKKTYRNSLKDNRLHIKEVISYKTKSNNRVHSNDVI